MASIFAYSFHVPHGQQFVSIIHMRRGKGEIENSNASANAFVSQGILQLQCTGRASCSQVLVWVIALGKRTERKCNFSFAWSSTVTWKCRQPSSFRTECHKANSVLCCLLMGENITHGPSCWMRSSAEALLQVPKYQGSLLKGDWSQTFLGCCAAAVECPPWRNPVYDIINHCREMGNGTLFLYLQVEPRVLW